MLQAVERQDHHFTKFIPVSVIFEMEIIILWVCEKHSYAKWEYYDYVKYIGCVNVKYHGFVKQRISQYVKLGNIFAVKNHDYAKWENVTAMNHGEYMDIWNGGISWLCEVGDTMPMWNGQYHIKHIRWISKAVSKYCLVYDSFCFHCKRTVYDVCKCQVILRWHSLVDA